MKPPFRIVRLFPNNPKTFAVAYDLAEALYIIRFNRALTGGSYRIQNNK